MFILDIKNVVPDIWNWKPKCDIICPRKNITVNIKNVLLNWEELNYEYQQ